MSDNVCSVALQTRNTAPWLLKSLGRAFAGATVRCVDPAPSTALYFDDLALGQRFVSSAREVTDLDIERFAALSGDHNPLHTDEAFARRSIYRTRIAHGMLVQSLATGLVCEMGIFEGSTLGVLEMQLRFVSAVRPGDSVRLELGVIELDPAPHPRRGFVRLSAQVIAKQDQLCIDGSWTLLLLRRTSPIRP